jgi:hypothetical protein
LHTLPAPCAQDAVDEFWPPFVICQSKFNLPLSRKFLPHFHFLAPSYLPISPFPPYQKSSQFNYFLPYIHETPPPTHSFYSSCPPYQCDSGLRPFALNNCLVLNPNCLHFPTTEIKSHLPHHALSVSSPFLPPPNPQGKFLSYPTSPQHHNIKLKPPPARPYPGGGGYTV